MCSARLIGKGNLLTVSALECVLTDLKWNSYHVYSKNSVSHLWPDLPKGVLCSECACTVSRHTFYRHLLATSMDQQHMCLILLKLEQSAFTQASFSSLSDVHECPGGLQMAPSSLGKHTTDCESPHDLKWWAIQQAIWCTADTVN